MQNTLTIFRREFAAYFNSPIAYIFIIAFLVLNSGLFMTAFFLNGTADLRGFFGNLPFFLIFFIPAVSMRLWAEDKRTGTFELLMTLPMRTGDVMMGKYLAALAFYLVALLGTVPLPIMVMALGNPDVGTMWSGYIGAALLGALYLGIGTFIASSGHRETNRWDLRLLIEIIDAVKYFVFQGDLFRFPLRENAFHLVVERVPFVLAPEIIHHQETTVQQIAAERLHLQFA